MEATSIPVLLAALPATVIALANRIPLLGDRLMFFSEIISIKSIG